MNNIIHIVFGAHEIDMPLAGSTVEMIQCSLRDVLNVDMDAQAYVDGRLVPTDYRVLSGKHLEFMKSGGSKGIGKTYTKSEFMQMFHMGEADWTDWVAKGLPFDTMQDGTIVLNETELDQWKESQREMKTKKRIVRRMVGAVEGGMLHIKGAAEYLGLTVNGLRKLVDKKEIRYFQRKRHSPILFQPEWLDEYIQSHTHDSGGQQVPVSPSRTRKQRSKTQNKTDDGRHGFRWDWIKG